MLYETTVNNQPRVILEPLPRPRDEQLMFVFMFLKMGVNQLTLHLCTQFWRWNSGSTITLDFVILTSDKYVMVHGRIVPSALNIIIVNHCYSVNFAVVAVGVSNGLFS